MIKETSAGLETLTVSNVDLDTGSLLTDGIEIKSTSRPLMNSFEPSRVLFWFHQFR